LAANWNFTVNQNFLLLQSNLANVYEKLGDVPDFSQLAWCLIDSNSGFVFLYCNGLNYSLIFESKPFLDAPAT
jgi:hypothetical protein